MLSLLMFIVELGSLQYQITRRTNGGISFPCANMHAWISFLLLGFALLLVSSYGETLQDVEKPEETSSRAMQGRIPHPSHSPTRQEEQAKGRSMTPTHTHFPERLLGEGRTPTYTHTISPSPTSLLDEGKEKSIIHMHSPSPTPAPARGGVINGTLEPSEAQAVVSLGVVMGEDPCNSVSQQTLICDESTPYKHIVYLHIHYCTEDVELPWSAWIHLSSLKALVFEECPAKPFKVPLALAHSLQSLTCIASLGTSVSHVLAPGLPGAWLGSFYNLLELSVSDVQVNASSLHSILTKMKHLQLISFSNTNLKGGLPSTWPSPTISLLHLSNNELHGFIPASLAELSQLQSLDLSSNQLKGEVPTELGKLQSLQYLSLASNQLSGNIPTLIQNLTSLLYLDLSHNQFTGSIPGFFTSMPNLRYIDLRGNYLEGVVPFTEGFLRGLNSCKLGENPGLCYNKSLVVSATLVQGVSPCEVSAESGGASPSPSPADISAPDPFIHLSLQRGPKKAVILIALALSCTMGAILTAALLSRHCASKTS